MFGIVSALVGIASAAVGFFSAKEQKDQAKKQARLQAEERRMRLARERANLRRQSRIRRSALVNTAYSSGLRFSSLSSNALQSVLSKEEGELGYLAQGLSLAQQGDEITKRQIELDYTTAQIGNITSGVNTISENKQGWQSLGNMFDTSETLPWRT